MQDYRKYLNHLAGISAAVGVASCAETQDTGRLTDKKPQVRDQVEVVVGEGVRAEALDLRFWPYQAFPDATFVRIFIPHRIGQPDQPDVQYLVRSNPHISKGDMQTRVEILRGPPEHSDKADLSGQAAQPE